MTLGEKIKQVRNAHHTTQSDLAELLTVARTAISNWEKDLNKPNVDQISKMCFIFGVSPNYFFDVPDHTKKSSDATESEDWIRPEEREHMKRYRAIDSFGKQAVDAVLNVEFSRFMSETKPVISLQATEEMPEIKTYTLPCNVAAAAEGSGSYLDGAEHMITILANKVTRQADLVVHVQGRSMEPEYQDGSYVLVRAQPEVEIGETGLWIVDGLGYIKRRGSDRLISANPDISDVYINEQNCQCIGKVVGELDPQWIIK